MPLEQTECFMASATDIHSQLRRMQHILAMPGEKARLVRHHLLMCPTNLRGYADDEDRVSLRNCQDKLKHLTFEATHQTVTEMYIPLGDVTAIQGRWAIQRNVCLAQSGSLYSSWPEPFQGSATHASQLGSDLTASQLTTGYSQFPLTSVSASHGWAGTSTGSGFGDYPTGYSPSSVSDASSEGRPDDDGDETYTTSQKGKKRRRDSDVRDDSTRKSRNPRKTAVACNFCRGRKLRCNGAKPACSNCMVRKFQCEYVPVQRRRGPGKAPKGTKSKKASAAARSEASTSLPPPGDHGSGAMAETTETGSMSLETFSFPSSSSSSPPKGGPSRRRKTRTPSVDSEADKRY
ncbi:hypothetical protein H0H81_008891 [Sphagnurus paluster]|uniref:Zn(2)-C6 fungal-type domain-containing protein n=1 Tax=Sphagnurus paluster TaxID=117069 RepID=A0A9P7FRX4_9AGAR|nr:hypothetical protein H0H81_008891 [Sphagnurus paluster]